jgi:hypothetical protein
VRRGGEKPNVLLAVCAELKTSVLPCFPGTPAFHRKTSVLKGILSRMQPDIQHPLPGPLHFIVSFLEPSVWCGPELCCIVPVVTE